MLRAVLTGMDTHPANSLAMVLRSIGYEVFMLSDRAMRELSNKGYTGGVYRDTLDSMGYHDTTIEWTDDPQGDMFIDLKLHDLESMLKIYPDLKGVLYVINGGWDDYEHYGEHYPTLTNNFWIKGAFHYYSPLDNVNNLAPQLSRRIHPPIGLLHNAYNWGFKALVDPIREKTGLRIFGSYGSPDGQIHNKQVKLQMSKSLCFIHLKASDCPGWALWEAFATATPIVLTEILIKRMKFEDLYIDGETCLTWGKTSYEQDKDDPKIIREFMDDSKDEMIREIEEAVEKLKNPEYNRKIGLAGHLKWKKLTEWTPLKQYQLKEYFKKHGIKTT